MKNLWKYLTLAVVTLVTSWAVLRPSGGELRAEVSGPVWFAGDTVRFIARFTTPAQLSDSVTIRWSLSGNNNINRTRVNVPASTVITDTVLFSAPPVLGGGTAGGDLIVRRWLGGNGSTGRVKLYNVTLADTGPLLDVGPIALLDSARVVN